ncbi:hypothetical protein SAMN05421640_1163 [Ekhidna lutea]|uniref:Uncharacterized protein n=1 Tax=Ekhidna lutea TaxID=447679 RepID=A0A239H6R5_EKHLU|nr:hypothetical protein [Ekhidna lutea]SNS76922.1 hypothetical protein SAMN05421640_1163 [Ekhidna lutea]
MKKVFLTLLIIGSATFAYTQKLSKIEEVLQSKQKWTAMDVKSNRPYFEIGETFTIRIDRKFYHNRNNYAKLGGDWSLDGKRLILTYDSFTEERRRIPYVYKIKKWGKNGFRLTYRNKYNKKEKVYFK